MRYSSKDGRDKEKLLKLILQVSRLFIPVKILNQGVMKKEPFTAYLTLMDLMELLWLDTFRYLLEKNNCDLTYGEETYTLSISNL